MLIVATIATLSLMNLGKELVTLAEEDIPLTHKVSAITINQLERAIHFERALRTGEKIHDDSTEEPHFKLAVKEFLNHSSLIDNTITDINSSAEHALKSAHTEGDKKEFKYILVSLKSINSTHLSYQRDAKQSLALLDDGDINKAHEMIPEIKKLEAELNYELESLLKELEAFTENAILAAEHDKQKAITTLLIVCLIAAIISILLASVIIRHLKASLIQAIDVAKTIASGDLTKEIVVSGNDETAQLLSSLSSMRNTLHTMIGEMNQTSTELAAASSELAVVSEQANQSIHEQQSEVEQIATAMNEMASTVQEVANNATNTSQSAMEADKESNDGKAVVQQTVDAIHQLSSEVDNAANVMSELEQQSVGIGGVLDVIKNIAEQTNLLALNAAIEAARAGEQGRGFAVVADEVRTLASRTQESTKEIETMVESLQSRTQSAVVVMQAGRTLAQESVECAMKAGESLDTITDSVTTINQMNMQIASAAEEQACVAEDMNKNIVSIKNAAEESVAAIDQTSASSEELSRMASSLQESIARFSI